MVNNIDHEKQNMLNEIEKEKKIANTEKMNLSNVDINYSKENESSCTPTGNGQPSSTKKLRSSRSTRVTSQSCPSTITSSEAMQAHATTTDEQSDNNNSMNDFNVSKKRRVCQSRREKDVEMADHLASKNKIKNNSTRKSRKNRSTTTTRRSCPSTITSCEQSQAEQLATSNEEGSEFTSVFYSNIGELLKAEHFQEADYDESTKVPEVNRNSSPKPESPETRRRRIGVVERQCRLHPSNAMLNQGPVINPRPISPGIVVGYTPAGQRYEVDLNAHRPTSFNSEYARRQFDDATRINVSRMMNDLEKGWYLPDDLDQGLERRLVRGVKIVSDLAIKHFQENHMNEEPNVIQEKLKLLEIEGKLVCMAAVDAPKINDFPHQLNKKINDLLQVQLTPLMLLKHSFVLESVTNLSKQTRHRDVNCSATVLLQKIKCLFDVPQTQTFEQYFSSEVKRLQELTKDMSFFDIFIMTKEPEPCIGNVSTMEEPGTRNAENPAEENEQNVTDSINPDGDNAGENMTDSRNLTEEKTIEENMDCGNTTEVTVNSNTVEEIYNEENVIDHRNPTDVNAGEENVIDNRTPVEETNESNVSNEENERTWMSSWSVVEDDEQWLDSMNEFAEEVLEMFNTFQDFYHPEIRRQQDELDFLNEE